MLAEDTWDTSPGPLVATANGFYPLNSEGSESGVLFVCSQASVSKADSSLDSESEFPVFSSAAEAEQHDLLQIEMDI